jgi:hypothetical protein
MKILWWVVRLFAFCLLLLGATLFALTGVQLYMLLSEQVQPGQPVFLDTLAMSHGESYFVLAKAFAILSLGFALSWFARTRVRARA